MQQKALSGGFGSEYIRQSVSVLESFIYFERGSVFYSGLLDVQLPEICSCYYSATVQQKAFTGRFFISHSAPTVSVDLKPVLQYTRPPCVLQKELGVLGISLPCHPRFLLGHSAHTVSVALNPDITS